MATAYVEIPLTQGFVATVDVDDYELVAPYSWCAIVRARKRLIYAARGHRKSVGQQRQLGMHQQILGNPDGHVDHWNGNGLDNRRANLRVATPTQNNANRRMQRNNTSGYKGVSWRKSANRWTAQICIARRLQHLGYFTSPEDAARAYDQAAIAAWGPYAALNFPKAGQQSAHRTDQKGTAA